MLNWLVPVYGSLAERSEGGVVTLDLEHDVCGSFKKFKAKRIGEQAAPPDLLEEMSAYFEEQHIKLDETRHEPSVDAGNVVKQTEFLHEFQYSSDAAKALFHDMSSKEATAQLKACFKNLCPERFTKKAKGSHGVANNCLIGFSRKQVPMAQPVVPMAATKPDMINCLAAIDGSAEL